jgi:hypothetical protein
MATPIDNCTGASLTPTPFSFGGGAASAPPASGLYLWLKADAGVTAPGGKVSHWVDQSGNGRHGSMATLSRQPSVVAGAINGLPVVRFFGAQSLVLDVLSSPTTYTVFVVGKNNQTSESFSMILGPGGSSPNHQLRWDSGTTALFVANNAGVIRTSPTGNTRVYHALSVRYDGSTLTFYRDGNSTSSSTFTATQPWTIAQVGAWFSQFFLVGDIAEIVIYNSAVSETVRQQVNSYLRTKYNLP